MRLLIAVLAILLALMVAPLPTLFSEMPGASQDPTVPPRLVEENSREQVFSNGLRVQMDYATANAPRFYQVLDRSTGAPSRTWYSQPVGLVFHTTESPEGDATDLASLRRRTAALARTLAENLSYNYLIDRTGVVWRIVHETDAAHHSGNSIWARGAEAYLNLNHSFLAVAFEARTPAGGAPTLAPAQLRSGRLLTEYLRARYSLAPENCVTHAQVSVNPANLRIGYHTDGAARFPFASLGLPDGYAQPPASVTDFGFQYDDAFLAAMGGQPWRGLVEAERRLSAQAARERLAAVHYRSKLQDRYRQLHSALKLTGAMDEPRELNPPS